MNFSRGLPRGVLWAVSLPLILLALLLAVGRHLLPLVAEYRLEVERELSAALAVPVSIGRLEGQWEGLFPRLVARDVRLGTGDSVLQLNELEAVLDIMASLEAQQVRLEHLAFQGLSLGLEEDAQGGWQVAGLPSDPSAPPPDLGQLLRLLRQVPQISLSDSRLRVRAFGESEHHISRLALGLGLEGEGLVLNAHGYLPDNQALQVQLQIQAHPDTWREQAAIKAYAKLPTSNWAQWLPRRLTGDWHLAKAELGAELWLDWQTQGQERAVVRLQAPRIELATANRAPLALTGLATTLYLQRQPTQGYQLLVDQLGLTQNGRRWPEMQISLTQQLQTDSIETALWQAQLNQLDSTAVAGLLQELLPLSKDQQALLHDLKPKGHLKNLSLTYEPKAAISSQQWRYEANLEQISFSSHGWIPAAGNVTGSISGDLEQGELRFDSEQFSLHLSELFPEAWHYSQAAGRLGWKVDDQAITLIAPYLQLKGEEGRINGDFLIRLYHDPKAESYMDLRVGLREGDSRFAGRYLPTRSPALSKGLVEWLNTAIKGGHIEQGYFQYQGSLNEDSHPKASSLSLYFKVADIELDYQKGWPRLREGRGEVLVEDSGTRVFLKEGRILNSRVQEAQASVPHVAADQISHLLLKGTVDGRVVDGLEILRAAPLDADDVFNSWQGDGQLTAQLDLDIPLDGDLEPRILVDFTAQGATLVMSQPDLRLEQLGGKFRYDSLKGVSASSIEARTLGGKVKARLVEAGSGGSPFGRIEAWGDVAVDRLSKWLGLGMHLPASGQLPFQLVLTLADQDSQLQIESSLLGTVLDLPAPFGKSATTARNTSLRMTLHGRERRYWVQYADLASLSFAGPPGRLNKGRGELRLGGGAARLPVDSGLRVQGSLATLDVADWQLWAKRMQLLNSKAPVVIATGSSLLSSVQLGIGRLTGFGLQVDNVQLSLTRQALGWQLGVNSDLIAGQMLRPDAANAPLELNIRHLRLPESSVTPAANTSREDPLAAIDPRDIPAMNIAIQSVSYGSEALGNWALKSRPTDKGVSFHDIQINLLGLHIEGSGGWQQTQSWYRGRIRGGNLGDVLKAWGFAPSVTSKYFQVDIDGHWPGSLTALDLKHFSGTLKPEFQNGQVLEMGSQALRIFGLLNFEAIGRRLRLDFTDLLGKGISYDEVKGVLQAKDGVYTTREPLMLTGPATLLSMNGTLDMAHDRIDSHLLVTLPFTGNLPLAAVIVGAPVVGGAVWAVDKLFGNQVSRLATVQYRVKGPWLSPEITFDKPFERPRS